MSTYKLLSYNTSWVNDASINQLHNFLSESASIVAKARALNRVGEIESDNKLSTFRMELANKATDYIKEKMDSGYDFIALVEQTTHVPADPAQPGSHANYDLFSKRWSELKGATVTNQQDIGNDNQKYGILLRIDKLGLNDVSVKQLDSSKPYSVVYDQVINPTIPTGPGGEGIGIAFKTSLVDTLLEWNQSTHPVRQRLLSNNYGILGGADFTGSLNPDVDVHYYSDDMGDVVCYDENRKLKYYNASGKAADLGRPIIMTAGVKGPILQIFVSLHGPNIFNMKFDTTDENGNPTQKQLKNVVGQNKYETEVTNMFDSISQSIGAFITSGFKSATNKQVLSDVTTVNLFLGGDANDPLGQLLQSILSNGIKININEKELNVKFTYTLSDNLYSCCANADSIIKEMRITEGIGLTGPIEQKRDDKYPPEFYNPKFFGYKGDYALFGSYPTPQKYELKLDNIESQTYMKNPSIIVSDHLPVISYFNDSTFTLPTEASIRNLPKLFTQEKSIPKTTKPIWKGGKTKKRSNKSKSKKRVSFGGRRTRKNNNKTRKNRH